MTRLRVSGIEQRYGERIVLKNLSLALEPPCILGVIGASGSGKSTLLKLLAGLHKPSQGTILGIPDEVAWVPQDAGLFPWLTIAENVALPLSYSRHFQATCDRLEQALKLCDEVGIGHVARHLPTSASGGERQRAALGRALSVQAKLLLLDEPFSALDTKSRTTLRAAVRETTYAYDMITVVATHELSDVAHICSHVLAIVDGPSSVYRELCLRSSESIGEWDEGGIAMALRKIDMLLA